MGIDVPDVRNVVLWESQGACTITGSKLKGVAETATKGNAYFTNLLYQAI